MKRVLPFLSIAILMVACNSKDKQSTTQTAQPAVTVDTTGFAQYQLWKAQHELSNAQDYQQQPQQEVAQAPAQQVKIIRVPVEHTRIIERQVSSSSHTATKKQEEAPAPVSTPAETTASTSAPASTSSTEGSTTSTGTGSTGGTTSGTTAPESTQKKTGMSNKTKDAVIGGVIGGAAGAVINKKNPVVGAVIGAVLGGGGGYIIGKKADQKQGRN